MENKEIEMNNEAHLLLENKNPKVIIDYQRFLNSKSDEYYKNKFSQKHINKLKRFLLYVFAIRKCKLSSQWSKYYDTVPRLNWTRYFTFYICNECWLKMFIIFIHWKFNSKDFKVINIFNDKFYKELIPEILHLKSMKIFSKEKKWESIIIRTFKSIDYNFELHATFKEKIIFERDKKIFAGNFFTLLEKKYRNEVLEFLNLDLNIESFSLDDFYQKIKNCSIEDIKIICNIIAQTNLFS